MAPLLLLTALGLTLFYLISKLYRHFTFWTRQNIPGYCFPTFQWAFKPAHQFQEESAARFGKIFGGYRTTNNILWLNDARLAREMSIKEMHKFPLRNSFHAGSSNLNKSLFFMEVNEDWKRVRSIVSPAFTSGKLRAMMTPIDRISHNFVEHMRPHALAGDEFDLKKYVGGFAMDVIAQCAYGIEIDSVTQPNHPVVVNAKRILNVDVSLSLLTCIFFPTVAKYLNLEPFNREAIEYFDDLTFKIVEQRMAKGDQKHQDLIGLMIEQAKDGQSNGHANGHANGTSKQLKGLSKDEISGQGILFFIAGFDTTHATFDHVIYYLTKYPEWQEKLYGELEPVKDDLDYGKLKDLPILNAIINEALRLRPPLSEFHRETTEDCELLDSGIKIPKNTLIIVQPYIIHRNPEYFPDPNEFKPERFLDKSQALESNFAYMPFGAGSRLCVGMRFAQNELRIGLAKLILNYRITADPKFELEYFNGSILMSPKRILVRISER